MSKLVYRAIASLDGYVNDASGGFDWAAPDEEVHRFVNDMERPIGTYLYGRRMYDVMRYWATADPSRRASAPRRTTPRSGRRPTRSSTRAPSPSPRRPARAWSPTSTLPRYAGSWPAADHDVSIGGATLAGEALAAGLVDEVHLFLIAGRRRRRHPRPAGRGPARPRAARRAPLRQRRRAPAAPRPEFGEGLTVTSLERLAHRVVMGAFAGTDVPDWAARLVDDGLGSVCVFGSNVASAEQTRPADRASCTAGHPSCWWPPTRRAATSPGCTYADGQPAPRQRGARRRRRPGLTERGRPVDRRRARRGRRRPRPGAGRRRQHRPGQPGHRRAQLRRRPGPGRPAHRGVRRGPAVGRRGRLRQALPGPRRHPRRLAPGAADRRRDSRTCCGPASWCRSAPR